MKFIDLVGHSIIDRLSDSSIVLDIGANVGMFSRAVMNRYGCTVVAYEAYTKICDEYLSKIDSPKFTYHNNAVWDKNEVITFWNYGEEWTNTGALNPWGGNSIFERADFEKREDPAVDCFGNKMTKEKTEVEAIPFDDILNGFDSVDLVKIDIEGAEIEVLTGVSDVNLLKCKQIEVEFHRFLGDKMGNRVNDNNIAEIVDRMSGLGFSYREVPGHPDYLFYQ
jgi:FkbM family methyltransferase